MKTRLTFLVFFSLICFSVIYSQNQSQLIPSSRINAAELDSLSFMNWHFETPMPEAQSLFASAFYQGPDTGYVYIFNGEYLNKNYKYNFVSHKWQKLGAEYQNKIYSKFTAFTIKGKIYIVSDNDNYMPGIYIYDIKKDKIEKGSVLQNSEIENVWGVYGDSLIYAYSFSRTELRSYIEIYNIRTNTWTRAKGNTDFISNYGKGILCGDKLFLIANENEALICSIDPTDPYTIKQITKKETPSKISPLLNIGSWYGQNNQYIFLLYSNTDYAAWVYDFKNDGFYKMPAPKNYYTGSSRLLPVIRNDSIYIASMGGFSEANNSSNEWLYIGPNDALTAEDIDVAALSIDTNNAYINDINIPTATIRNNGIETQRFDVTMAIIPGGYTCKKTVSFGLGETQIKFDPWIPSSAGIYTATVTANLAADVNLANNTINSQIEAVTRNISPLWHSELGIEDSTNNLEAVYYLKKSGNPAKPDTGYIIVFADLWKMHDKYTRGSISKYNTITRTWSGPDSSSVWLKAYHPVQLGGKIYLIGGQIDGTTCIYCGNELMIYDIEKDTVYYGSPMPEQCEYYAIGTFADSLIYVMGGYSFAKDVGGENGLLNLTQIYNVNTDTWSYGTPFTGKPRGLINGAISGSTIVLAGGFIYDDSETATVDIGVIDPSDPYKINWWPQSFLHDKNLEYFPGGKAAYLSSGSWFGKENKTVYFAEGRKIWRYDVSEGTWTEGPEKVFTTEALSGLMPVTRNDSAYMVMIGRDQVTGNITNEWYYIGNDEADPDIANEEEPNITAPKQYSLSQNYPNPFNPSTKIKYSVGNEEFVEIKVYDMLGREVKTLVYELKDAGEHEIILNAEELNLTSGVYLYRMKAGSFMEAKKFMLLK